MLLAAAAAAAGFALALLLGLFPRRSAPAPVVINTPAPTATISAITTPAPTATMQPIQVFVNGAVNAPDVYILSPDSRVKQVIDAAGGFSEGANTAVVNLALPLADGMHIYVPELVESTEVPGQVISQPTMQSRSGGGVGGLLININTAEQKELEELPGIGPVTAQKIIAYREAKGAFPDIAAILDVSGIGEVTFEEIRELITTGH